MEAEEYLQSIGVEVLTTFCMMPKKKESYRAFGVGYRTTLTRGSRIQEFKFIPRKGITNPPEIEVVLRNVLADELFTRIFTSDESDEILKIIGRVK